MKRLGQWLAESRVGRVAFGLGVGILFGASVYVLVHEEVGREVGRQTTPIVNRIEVIEQVEPIDLLRECLHTPRCRRLFRHPERVRPTRSEAGDASQPAPAAGQQPEPPRGGEREGRPRRPAERAPAPRDPGSPRSQPPPPAPAPQPSSASAPDPEPSPSNSGETPAAESGDGAEICVDLIVSACVDRDAPLVP